MTNTAGTITIAFEGTKRIAFGPLREVVAAARDAHDRSSTEPVLIFDHLTSRPIDIDFRGSLSETIARLAPDVVAETTGAAEVSATRGPGRPKLGVVPREITLLPRHWEWLGQQPGGASVAIRKLVDDAKKQNESRDRARIAQESAYRFMSTMAGNFAHFEEATRAFFANDSKRFEELTSVWPKDVRDHAMVLASRAFGATQYRPV